MVFGVVCEELGLIVALCCVLSLLLLAVFSVRSAAAGRSSYYVIASCATLTIFMAQLALNVFGSLDLLPFTGVTFPVRIERRLEPHLLLGHARVYQGRRHALRRQLCAAHEL